MKKKAEKHGRAPRTGRHGTIQVLRAAERRMASLISAMERSMASSSRSSISVVGEHAGLDGRGEHAIADAVGGDAGLHRRARRAFPTRARSASRCRCAGRRCATPISARSGAASNTGLPDDRVWHDERIVEHAHDAVGAQHDLVAAAAAHAGRRRRTAAWWASRGR